MPLSVKSALAVIPLRLRSRLQILKWGVLMGVDERLIVGSDNYISISGLSRADGLTISTVSSVTGLLKDSSGSTVSGSTFSMSLKSGTTDTYEGTIQDSASLTAGTTYTLAITIVADGLTLVKEKGMVAGTLFSEVLDIQEAIASIDHAIATGTTSVTVDGVTVNYRSLAELKKIRRDLVNRDNSGNYDKRPVNASITSLGRY